MGRCVAEWLGGFGGWDGGGRELRRSFEAGTEETTAEAATLAGASVATHDPLAAHWRAVEQPFDQAETAFGVDDDDAEVKEPLEKAMRSVMALEIHAVQLNRDGVCEEPEPTPDLSWGRPSRAFLHIWCVQAAPRRS